MFPAPALARHDSPPPLAVTAITRATWKGKNSWEEKHGARMARRLRGYLVLDEKVPSLSLARIPIRICLRRPLRLDTSASTAGPLGHDARIELLPTSIRSTDGNLVSGGAVCRPLGTGQVGRNRIFFSAGVLGLTDVNALVVSMVKDAGAQLRITIAARVIAVGVLANTLLKFLIGVLMGVRQFRRNVLLGLLAVALACAASLAWLK